jgi:hypothetical protein
MDPTNMDVNMEYLSARDPIFDGVWPSYPVESLGVPEQAYELHSNDSVLDVPASDIPHTFDSSAGLYANQLQNALQFGDVQSVPITQPLPTSLMEPPAKKRKKKVPTLRADAWEPYKARILKLHIEENRPLLEVKDTIEREFKFKAEYVSSGPRI